MNKLVPIGRFSLVTRLSAKTLRFYDAIGLLSPALIDPDNGYRYYGLEQAPTAERIRLLRSLGMPIEEIRALLRAQVANDGATAQELLARHQARLEQQLAETQQALERLRNLKHREESMTYAIRNKNVPSQTILYIRAADSLEAMDKVMPQAMSELYAFIARSGLEAAGPDFCRYTYPEDEAFAGDAVVPVTTAAEGAGEVKAEILPATTVAYVVVEGPYKAVIPPALQALLAWIQENGYEVAGALREIYHRHPNNTADLTGYRTELAWPIR